MIEEKMQQYYAVRAPEYDAVYLKAERQADLRALEIKIPALLAGRRVLEVAAGTGYWTQFIAPHVPAMLATDFNIETLAVAKQRGDFANLTFAVADAYCLPDSFIGFNGAFAGFWFSHIAKARRAEFLHGLHQHLEVGARVVLVDNRYVLGSSTPIATVDEFGDSYQLRHLSNGAEHLVIKNFPSLAELRELVADCAVNIIYQESEYFWTLSYELAVLEK